MTASNLDALDDHLIRGLYDPATIERGRAYAAEGRVKVLSSHPGSIRAACQGSGNEVYLLWIQWSVHGHSVSLDDSCTCPMTRGCKHCVAAILTARTDAAFTPRPARPQPVAWRQILGALDADDPPPPTGLALQLVSNRRARSGSAAGRSRLGLRPMRRGRSGRWAKSGATWQNIVSSYDGMHLGDADPAQRAALQAVFSSSRDRYYALDQPLPLDDFGPGIWPQLERAAELGVTFILDDDRDRWELSASAAVVSVDLTTGSGGQVSVRTQVMLDGELVALDGALGGVVGHPGHGVWTATGGLVRLAPFAEPLHPAVARLIEAGGVEVPPADVDELLDVYQPALARHASVHSSDSSVTLTSSEFTGLVLVVERTSIDTAALIWSARYRRGDRTIDHPLLRPVGRLRDHPAEAAAVEDLVLPGHLLAGLGDRLGWPIDRSVDGADLVVLLTEVVPWLSANTTIEVEIHGSQPALRAAEGDPEISLAITDGAAGAEGRNDWFDLHVSVAVDGEDVDFASLFAALHRGDPWLILPSGTLLALDRPEFERLRALIDEARGLADGDGTGAAQVNRFQTSWWDDLVELGVVGEQSERWAAAIGQMSALTAPEAVPAPAALHATLRPYQQLGLDWLVFLARNGLGGILADDMGLGKTLQTLALALHVLEEQPEARFLVVAPTSVVENWAREAHRFAPTIDVRTITETQARRGSPLADHIDGASLVVTSYALFRIDFDAYAELGWDVLLLDEAQFVKNHRSKIYRCARMLDAPTKVAITGTPLENSLMDLWSLLSITAPGLYPDPARFSETYRKPIERGDAPDLLGTLRRRIAPLLLRRTKDEVLADLPPKTEQVVEVQLNPRHAKIYATQLQRQRQKVLGLVGDVQQHRFEILKSLTLLRQLALDPALVDAEHDAVGSAKVDRLVDDLVQIVAEGHRALVFSQFTGFLTRVRARLEEAGIEHSYLDGKTRNRDAAISRFKDGSVPVFVISLKAGGFGLNLTEADYCFILDPWWNPATEAQAVDRTHRIGQENPVVVYRYVSVDTIEEKVMELKARKADLFRNVMDADGGLTGPLSEDDIRSLLDLRA